MGRQEPRQLSRGIDYFGSLSRILRDLAGPATLVYELLQNADDAPATAITFDVGEEALVVWNDGVFSDCGHQDLPPDDCPWLDEKNPPERCDFHRFRSVSAGDKARRLDLTGAFGIGFTAVYQITDKPELVSSGRHWIVDETLAEDSRIQVCSGCDKCRNATGTTFILPWARDPKSVFRTRAKVPAINPDGIQALLDELLSTVPTAMLFLKHIRTIEIQQDTQRVRSFERVDDGDDILIDNGAVPEAWRILRGDFDDEARTLQAKYPDKLDKVSELAIAIPYRGEVQGRLCAYLPTDEGIEMPFHVNADFFPRSDRKGLIAGGFQAEWNAAAVSGAACLLASHLTDLREVYGYRRLWGMIQAAHQVATNEAAKARGLALESFWTELSAGIESAPIVWTTKGAWRTPVGTYIVRTDEEGQSADVLAELGNDFAHADLRQYCLRLPGYGGLTQLGLGIFLDMLQRAGLTTRLEVGELPASLQESNARFAVLEELERLLPGPVDQRRTLQQRVDAIALAPGTDEALWPWKDCFSADSRTKRLFTRPIPKLGFLDDDGLPEQSPRLQTLVKPFGIKEAVAILEADEDLVTRLDGDSQSDVELLEWLTENRAQLDEEPQLAERLAALPIFPTKGTHKALGGLVLPGGFTDELGLSDVVDVDRARNSMPLLRKLGCEELTLADYVTRFVPGSAALATVDTARWKQLVLLLAGRLGEIEEHQAAQRSLRAVPIVITDDGFAVPTDAYLPSESLDRVLGEYTRAVLPPGHEVAVGAFYAWVGVATDATPTDIVRRVIALSRGPVTEDARAAVGRIVEHLGARWKAQGRSWGELDTLKTMRWLPAKSDSTRWYTPVEVYTVFNEYLFATQARFLGLPVAVQQGASDYLLALGVRDRPTTAQVVAHLLKCSADGASVNTEVYTFLNQNADDPEIARLRNARSILLPNGRWVSPRWVFWSDHPFGRFRARLGDDFHRFRPLLNRLGVREAPDYSDGLDVLRELSSELAPLNTPMESVDDQRVYAACWRLLADALTSEAIDRAMLSGLRDDKVAADGQWLLTRPAWILFDDVPGLADRFPPELSRHLVRRPEGYWMALREAGVRDLSRAATSHILELGDHEDHAQLSSLLSGRTRQIGRILDTVDPRWPTTLASRIANLKVVNAERLLVQFELSQFKLTAQPATLQTLYDPGSDTLFVRRDIRVSDLEVAREVARALAPDTAPGTLAPSLGLVFAAASADEADRTLDAAGVPRLAEAVDSNAEEQVVRAFGGDKDVGSSGTSDGSGRNGDGGVAPASEHGKGGGDGQLGARGRLRSYVLTGGEISNSNENNGEREEQISAVDRAGVARVIAFETAAGRNAKQMQHHNPGYDVESSGADGQVLRYIEVKSIGGDWTEFGVSVTPRQMDEARSRRELFWLYVVERAESDDFTIYPIQDPWSKVNQFMFDDPWRLVASAPVAEEASTQNSGEGLL